MPSWRLLAEGIEATLNSMLVSFIRFRQMAASLVRRESTDTKRIALFCLHSSSALSRTGRSSTSLPPEPPPPVPQSPQHWDAAAGTAGYLVPEQQFQDHRHLASGCLPCFRVTNRSVLVCLGVGVDGLDEHRVGWNKCHSLVCVFRLVMSRRVGALMVT